jgi:hypothetical protein
MVTEKKAEDLLIEDPEIPGQKYVLLSFLSPERIKDSKQKVRGLKIRGVYCTKEEAEEQCKYIRDRIDSNFDIYVGEVGKWLPWDDTDKTDDENYAEKELNDLMKAYRQQRILSKQEVERRRDEEVRQAAEENKRAKASLKNSP